MILGFVGMMILITGLIHLYLWKRLVRDTTLRGRGRRIGGFVVLALALVIPVTLAGSRAGAKWLAWPGYLWLAVMFYLLVLLILLEIPMLPARIWLRRRAASTAADPAAAAPVAATAAAPLPALAKPEAPAEVPAAPDPHHDPGRRLLLARGTAIFAGLAAVGITGYGVSQALGPPRVNRVRIPLAKLDPRGDGLRVALVSDIHLGPILGRGHTERIVATINRLEPDLVAVVGDLVDGSVAELGPAAAPLRDLRPRYGSFFVTGNHEYFSGYEEWVEEVDRLGLRPLRNERVEIVHGGAALDLAGVNDVNGKQYGDGPDFARTLDGRDTSRPVVLLAHQPVQAHDAARHGVDLQLSGHTHGGQIVPFNLLVGAQQPVVSGLGTVDGTKVFVTNGAGFWGPPVRVGAPPQVTLVELHHG
jgi:predicted MPP superfamily phosphohydrolase